MLTYEGILPGEVVERDVDGNHTVEFGFGTVGGNFATFRLGVAVDDPDEYKTLPVGTQVLVGFVGGRSELPVLIGVLRRGHDAEFPLDHVDDDIKRWPAGLRRKVSGEDAKVTLSHEGEGEPPIEVEVKNDLDIAVGKAKISREGEGASTIEIVIEDDLKITVTSPKKIQLHGKNIELGGSAARALLTDKAGEIYNAHTHSGVTTGGGTSGVPTAGFLITGAKMTNKVKAE